jgi:hypothetical protein
MEGKAPMVGLVGVDSRLAGKSNGLVGWHGWRSGVLVGTGYCGV